MSRVNISLPDELYRQAKEAGVNISKITQQALVDELSRLAKIAAVDQYLAELEAEQGAPTAEEMAAAEAWANRMFGAIEQSRTA